MKCVGIWVSLVPIAILNWLIREKCLGPLLGQRLALPFSAISCAARFFLLTWLSISWLGSLKPSRYWLIGLAWMPIICRESVGRTPEWYGEEVWEQCYRHV